VVAYLYAGKQSIPELQETRKAAHLSRTELKSHERELAAAQNPDFSRARTVNELLQISVFGQHRSNDKLNVSRWKIRPMSKILVIEDDPVIAASLKTWLQRENFVVETAADGGSGLELLLRYKFDLLVLDWNLPDISGIEIARQLSCRKMQIPILMLTTHSTVPDKVSGLDAGAWDYVTKPCPIDEITARIRALLRRPGEQPADDPQADFSFSDLRIDENAHMIMAAGQSLKLSPSEFQILRFLAANPGRSFSPEAIVARVWKNRAMSTRQTVYVHIRHIREKLASTGCKVKILTNEIGEYLLSDTDAENQH
jgi:DNA-binding response OmpR family regulator